VDRGGGAGPFVRAKGLVALKTNIEVIRDGKEGVRYLSESGNVAYFVCAEKSLNHAPLYRDQVREVLARV